MLPWCAIFFLHFLFFVFVFSSDLDTDDDLNSDDYEYEDAEIIALSAERAILKIPLVNFSLKNGKLEQLA